MVLKTNTSETKNKAWLLFIRKSSMTFSDDIPVALSWPIVMQYFFPSPEVLFYNLTNLGFYFFYITMEVGIIATESMKSWSTP